MEYIFIALYGWEGQTINQKELIYKIGSGFECWDLKKISFEDFIIRIKKRIPSINKNVLNNYIASDTNDYGITKEQFKDCNWGLLIPNPTGEIGMYHEMISVMNLYSTSFLRPAFYATYFGIHVVNKKPLGNWLGMQNRAELFKTKKFISFFKQMSSHGQYFRWYRGDVLKWNDEDWRLFMAATFYRDLEGYELGKSIYTWQRESADMATLLETLFTAGESDKEEIGYRLRKRTFVLIGWKFPFIEKEIKELYNDRSEFVHGSYFKKITKSMKKNKNSDEAMPPLPDFDKLHRMKECLRFSFVAYLHLHAKKVVKTEPAFDSFENVQKLLEEAILNTELRKKIIKIVKPVVDLLPESNRLTNL